MKKILLLLYFMLLFAATACADQTEVFSFRDVEFGMTQEQVALIETGEKIFGNESSLHYNVEDLYNLKTYCRYIFSEDKLQTIRFNLSVPKTDDFKSKYNEILKDLLEKYKANDESVYLLNDRYSISSRECYFIINEETFVPGIVVSLAVIDGRDNNFMILIYFNAIDNVEIKSFLKEYKDKLTLVKQQALNKIINK